MRKKISLTEKEQFALIQNASHDELLKFISDNLSFRFTENASKVFVERGNSEEILAYISTRSLAERGEIALIKRGVHNEILAYTQKYKLCESAEKALIQRGVETEILAYLEINSFCANAMVDLIYRGNIDEIEKAARRSSFGFKAENELINFGVHRHIMAYIKIRKFCSEEALKAFFKRGNESEIVLYKFLYEAQ